MSPKRKHHVPTKEEIEEYKRFAEKLNNDVKAEFRDEFTKQNISYEMLVGVLNMSYSSVSKLFAPHSKVPMTIVQFIVLCRYLKFCPAVILEQLREIQESQLTEEEKLHDETLRKEMIKIITRLHGKDLKFVYDETKLFYEYVHSI